LESKGTKEKGEVLNKSGEQSLNDKLIHSEKLASVGQLAVGIAHELRNPLAVISASAQFCLEKHNLDNDLKEHFQVINRNVRNANILVTNLLNFAKPTEMEIKYNDINKIIRATLKLLKPEAEKRRLAIKKALRSNLPKSKGDEKTLQHLFMNIILNAFQATSRGGTVTLKSTFDSENKIINVDVIDTGSGIPEEYINEIFNPFFTTKDYGTGLGLTICHHIISAHNGRLSVKSKYGKGSTFSISLPA